MTWIGSGIQLSQFLRDFLPTLSESFSKFCRSQFELVFKFNTGLRSLLQHGLSEPEFYGD